MSPAVLGCLCSNQSPVPPRGQVSLLASRPRPAGRFEGGWRESSLKSHSSPVWGKQLCGPEGSQFGFTGRKPGHLPLLRSCHLCRDFLELPARPPRADGLVITLRLVATWPPLGACWPSRRLSSPGFLEVPPPPSPGRGARSPAGTRPVQTDARMLAVWNVTDVSEASFSACGKGAAK